MKKLSVIIPSFMSKDLDLIAIKSFESFRPVDLEITYIIVENTDAVSYKKDIMGSAKNIVWINNPTLAIGSEANAEAIEIGLKLVHTEWVFLCHCDVCVTSSSFFDELNKKVEEGYKLIGTVLDPARIKAIHISGYLTTKELADSVSHYPIYVDGTQILDVGDRLTEYCREHGIKSYCFKNTFNVPELASEINDAYREFQVDRCLDEKNEVMFMHLGRGIPKTQMTYSKTGKVDLKRWIEFCRNKVVND